VLLRLRKQFSKLYELIPDEPGYVPASRIGSELLFDVINSACECQSLIVTTNLPFENWTEVLSSERLTVPSLVQIVSFLFNLHLTTVFDCGQKRWPTGCIVHFRGSDGITFGDKGSFNTGTGSRKTRYFCAESATARVPVPVLKC
jgi:hypothetical protein